MTPYLNALKFVLENGQTKTDRTGTGTISSFGVMMRFNLQDGFPAVTTKKLFLRSVWSELEWFLREGVAPGREMNTSSLGSHIWDAWADKDGNLGPIYGKQWRQWGGVDQIRVILDQLKNSPDSRRILLSAWNVAELEQMKLPPCHVLAQFNVTNNKLSCLLYQRSCDLFLGGPFNVASYALLTHLFASLSGLEVGELVHTIGDAHIYLNHVEQVKEQLSREPFPLPQLRLPVYQDIDDFRAKDVMLVNYQHHPAIRGEISV